MTDNSNRRQTKHLAVSRRGALQAGLLGLGGLSLPAFLRQQANAGETLAGDTAVIFLFLHGGPSQLETCLLYTSPSPRDGLLSRMPSSA